jgi:hypothetical protein
MTDYVKPVTDYLAQIGVTYSTKKTGEGAMTWDEPGTTRDIYSCMFTREGRKPLVIEPYGQALANSKDYIHTQLMELAKQGLAGRNWNTFSTPACKAVKANLKAPDAYDVLCCVQKQDVGSFSEFCDEFGYSTDSRMAHDAWEACAEEWARVKRFFSTEELEKLEEIAR